MNAFNKLIYDQAIPNLTENEILDINTYIDMVEEKMIENNQSYLKIIEEELNKRKTIENQSVITPTINLGGVMSNPAAYNSDTPIL
jgi:mannose/fructose/N-acetylgalactosamine-specific phosphotransferase system component IIB